jgi:hypothetical protein
MYSFFARHINLKFNELQYYRVKIILLGNLTSYLPVSLKVLDDV